MTRKRFIRLLMAKGYSRNDAHDYAWFVQGTGQPYATAYAEICVGLSYIEMEKAARSAGLQIADAYRKVLGIFSATCSAPINQVLQDMDAAFRRVAEALTVRIDAVAKEGDET